MQKHKLLAFLLALVVSVALWLYAVTVVNPDDTTTINGVSVVFTGADALLNNNLILTGGEGQRVNVEISGRRSDLKELNSTSLTAVANVGNISTAGVHEVSWSFETTTSVALGDIRLVSASRNKVSVTISELQTLPEIPIEVAFTGELAPNFLREDAALSQESVSVSGPAEEVEQIDHALVTIALDGVSEPISGEYAYSFYNAQGEQLTLSEHVSVPTPTVRVSVPIFAYKQIALQARMVAGGGATASDATCKFEPSSIIVTGSEELLAQMDDTLEVPIDLATLTETRNIWTFTPTLPTGVSNRAEDPTIRITLTFSGLRTREFTVDCAEITVLNNAEDLEIAQQTVTIKVRGKRDIVDALTLDAFTATISADMSAYDAGTRTVKLSFAALTGGASVIAGPYSVTISESG